ncbi:cytochrome P450 [Streptomyces abyssomicinicus]|uniref:cytochrome P450 n=1 Tax=Streptomyces abyssomicinicus TaxID=574929 RepID=UPI0012503B52|nr:cytochrome P450 [Streptomyces abyssomicinicus]
MPTAPPGSPSLLAFPQPRTCPHQPPPGYDALRGQGPLAKVALYDGRDVWLVTGYAEARALLSDPRLSSDRTRPGFPVLAPRFRASVARKLPLIAQDPPVHDVHRRLLNPEFSLKHVRAMRPQVQEIVDRFIDRMLEKGPPSDLVADFAVPVTSLVVSRLLGVPVEDQSFFQDATSRLMRATEAGPSQQAGGELAAYLDRLVTRLRTEPGDGVLGRLASQEVEEGRLPHDELVQIALVLLVAGHETTASMIALGTIALLEHPERLAELRADPDVLPGVVEELLRLLAVTDLAGSRVAVEDIAIAGHTIRAGDGVLVSGTLANRDPDVHADPDVFDPKRAGRSHLTFGYGIHQCLGQNLARLELELAFRSLFTRIPTLRLTVPAAELPVRGTDTGTIQSADHLPVTW